MMGFMSPGEILLGICVAVAVVCFLFWVLTEPG
jgi:hypothetical protein